MSKSNKAKVKIGNPIDAFFNQQLLGFEFFSDVGEYQILIDTMDLRAKVQKPNGQIIDKSFEDYFENDLFDNEDFELWLRSLLMSLEFFASDVWEK